MKYLRALFILVVILGNVWAEEPIEKVEREARLCAAAAIDGDYGAMLRYTNPRIVTSMGGKDSAMLKLRQAMEGLSEKGMRFEKASIGTPSAVGRIGSWLIALVPEQMTLSIPGGRAKIESSLFATSEDGGATWTFVDLGALPQKSFDSLFPEFAGKFKYPLASSPQIETNK